MTQPVKWEGLLDTHSEVGGATLEGEGEGWRGGRESGWEGGNGKQERKERSVLSWQLEYKHKLVLSLKRPGASLPIYQTSASSLIHNHIGASTQRGGRGYLQPSSGSEVGGVTYSHPVGAHP